MSHAGVESLIGFLADSELGSASIEEQRRWMADVDRIGSWPRRASGSNRAPSAGDPRSGCTRPRECEAAWCCTSTVAATAPGRSGTHRHLAGRIALAASGASASPSTTGSHPNTRFPSAIADATAAYEELRALGHPPEEMAVAGDSAGGGLTLATLLTLRDAGAPLPAAAACLSPWTRPHPVVAQLRDGRGRRPDGLEDRPRDRSWRPTSGKARRVHATRGPPRSSPTSAGSRRSASTSASARSCSTTRSPWPTGSSRAAARRPSPAGRR